MKEKSLFLVLIISLCFFSCDKKSECRSFINNINLTDLDYRWTCQHNDYSWTPYYGSFNTKGKQISSDIWTPPKDNKTILQYKQILYCDSILLEELDVYYSPNMYSHIDGNRCEVLTIGFDYYENIWRCIYEYAIKDNCENQPQFYGFNTDFIEKTKADSIIEIWTKHDNYSIIPH